MALQPFSKINALAAERKGGEAQLKLLLPEVLSNEAVRKIPDHRFLAEMTRCINQAGFSWTVINNKWPEFEEAFFGFDLDKLSLLPDDRWEAYTQDKRVVRSWQKIKAVRDNLVFMLDVKMSHGSFGNLVADWPSDDQAGLMKLFKKQGARLGGNTGSRVLRNLGKDAYILTGDVILGLKRAGVDIQDNPTSQKDLKAVQSAFNEWHQQAGLPYAYLSRILACSIGENHL